MKVEVEWQVIDEEDEWQLEIPAEKPRPKRRISWRWVLAAAAAPVVLALLVGSYAAAGYRKQLARVQDQVRLAARIENQAVANHDQDAFMALQDPEDAVWQQAQSIRFGVQQNTGMVEFGWKATDAAPQAGAVALEPGGAQIDMTYALSVTDPMPGGPAQITLRVPQFYKQTPQGWVRAQPESDYWGSWRSEHGNHVTVQYFQQDAGVIEPLIPQLDDVVKRTCEQIPCLPTVPVYFDNSPTVMAYLQDFTYGYTNNAIRLPSPHLTGMPVDSASRAEVYRAYEIRVVQALVYEASGRQMNTDSIFAQEIVHWELARVGLIGSSPASSTTPNLASMIQSGRLPSLARIRLMSYARRGNTQAVLPVALSFLEEYVGPGSVDKLIPVMGASYTLSQAISQALNTDPNTLEVAWQQYAQEKAGLAPGPETASISPPYISK